MQKAKRLSGGDIAFNTVTILIMILLMLLCVYPFYYVFIYSISDPVAAQKGIILLPRSPTLSNYRQVFELKGISGALVISVLRTLIGTGLTIFCCSFFAYLVTKENMIGRKFIYRMTIVTMYFSSGLIPWYLTMKLYHLNNNFLVYVIPTALSAYYIVLLKTFIEQLPPSLEESAKLDGAGYFKIFSRIIFPLSKPIVATIAVFAAVGQWNSWFDNYILVSSDNLKTLQLVLYEFLNQASSIATMTNSERNTGAAAIQITPEAVSMTITMVVTLPILFVYPFMQKYFVKGIMLGAVKG
jgi:putative aldouronate transport system permease protein